MFIHGTLSLQSTFLSTYVSKDPSKERDSAKKVMTALLSNSLAKKYSLRGQKGKSRFDELKVWTAVKGKSFCELSDLRLVLSLFSNFYDLSHRCHATEDRN